jgi:hypothetical protein
MSVLFCAIDTKPDLQLLGMLLQKDEDMIFGTMALHSLGLHWNEIYSYCSSVSKVVSSLDNPGTIYQPMIFYVDVNMSDQLPLPQPRSNIALSSVG